jgi:hypothetical protein
MHNFYICIRGSIVVSFVVMPYDHAQKFELGT